MPTAKDVLRKYEDAVDKCQMAEEVEDIDNDPPAKELCDISRKADKLWRTLLGQKATW